MKQFLILLLSLLSLTTQAQGLQKIKRTYQGVEQKGRAIRDLGVYPRTDAGTKKFLEAVNTSAVAVTLNSGVVIPAIVTIPPAPTWASLRYSLTNNLLYVEGAGEELTRLKFSRVDGTALSGTNPDNVPLVSGTFYGFGANDGQGSYTKQWKASFTPAIAGTNFLITAERNNGETYAYPFVPKAGASREQLYTAGGVTTPPVTTPTYPSYTIGLMLGNSITTYRASTVPGEWPYDNAMAVDATQYDNAHIVEATLKTVNASFRLVLSGIGSGLEQAYNSSDADAVSNNISVLKSDLARDYPGVQFNPFIYSFGGENTGGTYDEAKLRTMFDKVMAAIPRPVGGKVIFRTSFYKGKDQTDAFVRSYCAEKGYAVVDISDVQERTDLSATEYLAQNQPGWAKHPNRNGHALIAARMLDKIKTGTTSTSPVASNPGSTFTYPMPTAQQAWSGFNSTLLGHGDKRAAAGEVYVIESEQLKVEFRKRYGGAIQIYDKLRGNRPLLNWPDHGRQGEVFVYSGPNDYSAPLGGQWFNIGWNPGTTGNEGQTGSPVQSFGLVTESGRQYVYSKTQMLNWPSGNNGHPDDLLECWNERWIRLEGDKVHVKFRITTNRANKTQYPYPYQQEWPVVLVSGSENTAHYVVAGGAYGTGSITSTNMRENRVNPAQGHGVPQQFEQTPFFLAEPWQAVNMGTTYFGIVSPEYYRSTSTAYILWGGGGDGASTDNSEGSNPATYISALPRMTIDPVGTKYGEYTYMVNAELTAIRQYALSLPRTAKPDFTFDKAHGRNRWYVWAGTDQMEPFDSDGWKPKMGAYNQDAGGITTANSKLTSPAGRWEAAQTPTVYVRMAYSGSATSFRLDWVLSGQAEDGVNGDYPNQAAARWPRGARDYSQQHISFPVQNDGQMHTYAVPVSSKAMWTDVVQQISLMGWTSQNDVTDVRYIGATNPN